MLGSIEILHVATDLGLRPSGVRGLGSTLIEQGLAERLDALVVEPLIAGPFVDAIDPTSGARNVAGVATLAHQQADRVGDILDRGAFPVVLGGDDTVMFGCLLALRRRGSAGLVMLDGHTDFWDPRNGSSELSDSDLWIATGHGPAAVADPDGLGPLVAERACVVYGHRDRAAQLADHSEDVYATPMLVRNLAEVRAAGLADAARHAGAFLGAAEGGPSVAAPRRRLSRRCGHASRRLRLDGGLITAEVVGLARPPCQIPDDNPVVSPGRRRTGERLRTA